MSMKKWQAGLNMIAFLGLAASLAVVIHSLVTGQGIHTLGFLLGIFLLMMILEDRKGRAWRGIPVIAFAGAVAGLSLFLNSLVTGQGIDAIALGGGTLFALLGLMHAFLIRSGHNG